ncbi:nucleotidyltransferase family protein [Paractinoplanes brasiliensis]|uniref:Nicotine blue oxidoreductase n=1 Tax=Paractinoplanes brasiliensis TaxID=52695 RepID=A0A4R6JXT1_9ACTN|nr:nucleotidyltransferase family protein [Actinoplanes brasiliensis]TDO41187.1 nicotine blue oxidoreductase [Actinoplanes brasiliensis]GID26258.1 4-diphosphocytidyl-2C-methyl-D-erythritol synthase [Actinoplanes brasiliensis]
MAWVTAGVVLAAGAGRRYGMPKALIPYPDRLLVERAADTLREAGASPVVVVLGADARRVIEAAPGLPQTVINPEWETGMGSSLRAGLRALDGSPADAAVILLVDMPGITAGAVRRVIAYSGPDALVMGGYGGRRGHPVLLGREHWAGVVASAVGDQGARGYLKAHPVRVVPVDDVADDLDLDVPELNPHA